MKTRKTKTQTLPAARKLAPAQVAEFQKIVQLLVDFDEKTGRWERYADPETHFARRALAVYRNPERLTFDVQDLGGFVYRVTAELEAGGTYIQTVWTHEDGIAQERQQGVAPAAQIRCLTDFYNEAAQ